jgi:hypothetical protein
MGTEAALARLEALLAAARGLRALPAAAAADLEGRLVASSGLSAAGVRFAFERCLETQASRADLELLIQRAGTAPIPNAGTAQLQHAGCAHVLLSSTVFTAALRAIALALAATPRVFVKPSQRAPVFCQALHAQVPELFTVVGQITPEPGDVVWAYGHDVTLSALQRELPAGVHLRGYGEGFGLALLRPPVSDADLDSLVQDAVAFDQEGCLSPRLVLIEGEPGTVESLGVRLAAALHAWGQRVPRGARAESQRAAETWYQQVVACFGPQWITPSGSVHGALLRAPNGELELPPPGRNLTLAAAQSLAESVLPLAPWLTSVGYNHPALGAWAREHLHGARVVPLGSMQTPPLDGPVDLRFALPQP